MYEPTEVRTWTRDPARDAAEHVRERQPAPHETFQRPQSRQALLQLWCMKVGLRSHSPCAAHAPQP